MKVNFEINGMSCNSCAEHIECALKDKVNSVSASYSKGIAEIDFNENKISESEIKNIIKETGYEVKEEIKEDKKINDSENKKEPDDKDEEKQINNAKTQIFDYEEKIQNHTDNTNNKKGIADNIGWFVLIGSVLLLVFILYYFVLRGLDLEIPSTEKTSIFLLFLVGILTGFHCVSMCGGFVVSYTTKNAIKGHKGYKQHLVYGGSKLFSYALIGGIFGLIGGIFAFSFRLRGIVAILAGSFMIFYALSMMGIKFFRKFQFNPKFLSKAASNASSHAKGKYKAPFITGLLSGLFIACGPLQAMYLYAAGTGNFFSGMISLTAFGLGTLPIMIGFGSLTSVISHKATKRILKISAIIVLVLGLVMLNRGLTVMGSPVSYDVIKDKIIGEGITGNVILTDGVQEINMEVNRYGWEPKSFVLKKGIPVKWNINVKELTGCNNEIIVKDYGLDIKLKKGMNVVEFTPDKTGTVRWSCWMGMIPGSFVVTESGSASQEEIASATPQGGGCGGSCGSPSCGAATGGGCGCGG